MRNAPPADHEKPVPQPDQGLTVLHRPLGWSQALYRFVISELVRTERAGYWVDTRTDASSYALHGRASQFADAAAYPNVEDPHVVALFSMLLAREVEVRQLREELQGHDSE